MHSKLKFHGKKLYAKMPKCALSFLFEIFVENGSDGALSSLFAHKIDINALTNCKVSH